MEFSRLESWSVLPFPSPGDRPDPGSKPRFPTLQADALLYEPPGKTILYIAVYMYVNPSLPVHPTLSFPIGIHMFALYICLYFCFASKILCAIFLAYTYMH